MFQFQFMQGVIHFHVDYGRVQRLYGCGDVVIMRARSVIVQWIQNRHCLYAAVMFGMYSAACCCCCHLLSCCYHPQYTTRSWKHTSEVSSVVIVLLLLFCLMYVCANWRCKSADSQSRSSIRWLRWCRRLCSRRRCRFQTDNDRPEYVLVLLPHERTMTMFVQYDCEIQEAVRFDYYRVHWSDSIQNHSIRMPSLLQGELQLNSPYSCWWSTDNVRRMAMATSWHRCESCVSCWALRSCQLSASFCCFWGKKRLCMLSFTKNSWVLVSSLILLIQSCVDWAYCTQLLCLSNSRNSWILVMPSG